MIGRLGMPIFSFCIAEGYAHTRDKLKYLCRIGIFTLISEIPFDLAFEGRVGFDHQNIMLTFFLAVSTLMLFDRIQGGADPERKSPAWRTVLGVFAVAAIAILALLHDYPLKTGDLQKYDQTYSGMCFSEGHPSSRNEHKRYFGSARDAVFVMILGFLTVELSVYFYVLAQMHILRSTWGLAPCDTRLTQAACPHVRRFVLNSYISPLRGYFLQTKQPMPSTAVTLTSLYIVDKRSRRLSSVSNGGVKNPLGT